MALVKLLVLLAVRLVQLIHCLPQDIVNDATKGPSQQPVMESSDDRIHDFIRKLNANADIDRVNGKRNDMTPVVQVPGHQLEKRVVRASIIRVVYHFKCPLSGPGQEVFEWAVHWNSRTQKEVQFTDLWHITEFTSKYWDNEHYPSAFQGSWYYRDLFDRPHTDCRFDYTGWFEGSVRVRGVSVYFIDKKNDLRTPTIMEHCRNTDPGHYHNGSLNKWTLSMKCEFLRAEVYWPKVPNDDKDVSGEGLSQ